MPTPIVQAVIFDLDGVIVSTDDYHYQAWQQLADEEGIYFDRDINQRLRGVSRMQSLDILLERSPRAYSVAEKETLAQRKNTMYRALLKTLTPAAILPGVGPVMRTLKQHHVKLAVCSSSKNTPLILAQIGLTDRFDVIVDGNDIAHSKPNPECFLLAAQRLMVAPGACVVIEDAAAGVAAAIAAGMRVIGVGYAVNVLRTTAPLPTWGTPAFQLQSTVDMLLGLPVKDCAE